MSTASAAEFPFAESMPKPAYRPSRTPLEAFQVVVDAYVAASAVHGVLVPPTTVAQALGITPQRVKELMDLERLEGVLVCDRRWVTANSVRKYLAEGPRKGGRPRKTSVLANGVRAGWVLAKTADAMMD